MPNLIIDNIPVEVPPGTNVLEAAKKVGIIIPHFCYHEALGAVGACRLCAMKFIEGPVKGVQMSCMIPAQDGMVVSSTDGEAARLRQLVIEWLMINHPHDCPVCDEGGECLLQDFTIAGGHGIRRYKGKKRTFLNQYLGPYIEHEMNRCIECYRCARFYQEYAGGTDLGTMGSAGRVYFGRFEEGELESPFSGNLVDICPTGVYTDKTARFRARYWDYDMAPSVCPWCSLGCNTVPAARYRELLKTGTRRNDSVNGFFICDRGRFNNYPINDPERPRVPLVDTFSASWDEALDAAAQRLDQFLRIHGHEALAIIGSPRLPLEGAIMLQRLAETLRPGFLCYFNDSTEAGIAGAAVGLTARKSASMADVRNADMVVIADCDLAAEGPMLALSVRQAWRKGAALFATGSTPAETLEKSVSVKMGRASSLEEVPFSEAKRPVVICGTRCTPGFVETASRKGARIACLLSGPDAFGAGLLARRHRAVSFAEALASGSVKGILSFEADIGEPPAGVSVIVAADWQATAAVRQAQVVLPTAAWVETDGTFINYEGRAQRFARVMHPGLPIKGLGPALHPPHIHRTSPPGGDVRPAWVVVAELLERVGGGPVEEPLTGQWQQLRILDPESEGIKVDEASDT